MTTRKHTRYASSFGILIHPDARESFREEARKNGEPDWLIYHNLPIVPGEPDFPSDIGKLQGRRFEQAIRFLNAQQNIF